jgi:hypothetical protein
MYRQAGAFAVLLLVLSGAALAQQSPAETPDRAALVAEILNRGEKRVSGAIDAARESFKKAEDDSPRDLRIDYAFALVLARQQSYDESLELFDTLQSKAAGNMQLLASRMQIWILLQQKKNAEALRRIKTAADQIASSSPAAKQGKPCEEIAGFLGRTYAFLELGQPKDVEPDELERVKKLIAESMTPNLSTAFTRGFEGTKKKYEKYTTDILAAKEKAPKIYEAKLKSIDEELEVAGRKSQDVQEQLKNQEDDLRRKKRPLADAVQLAEERQERAEKSLKETKDAAANAPNPQAFDFAVRQGESAVNAANEERLARIRNLNAAELAARPAIENSKKSLQRLTREITRCKQRRKETVNAGPGKSTEKDSNLRSQSLLSSYVDAPFDAEKKRILASYGK